MLNKLLFSLGLAQLTFYYLFTISSQVKLPQNSPPKVLITQPSVENKLRWNSFVPFSIDVSDLEDGKSAYDEITPSEVLLQVQYLPDSSQLKKSRAENSKPMHQALLHMSRNNCFQCHRFKYKLIGPSFTAIAKQYTIDSSTVELLAEKMMKGSTGHWGDLEMPPNPDLQVEEAKKMVHWILAQCADENQTHYVGTEGAFKTRQKKEGVENGKYLLTARYVDHGVPGQVDSEREGKHTVVMNIGE